MDTIAIDGEGPELDGTYPYGYKGNGAAVGTVTRTNVTDDTAIDAPGIILMPQYGETQKYQNSTMFLLWTPNADTSVCTDGTTSYPCSIPVPLGSLTWLWTGDAINTLEPLTGSDSFGSFTYPEWVVNCGSGSNGGFQTSAPSYPQWTMTTPLSIF